MAGITDIGADAASQSQSNSNDESDSNVPEFERFDLDGCSFGKQHPTTAIRGTAVALRAMYDEDDPDRSDVSVILDDPSVVTDEEALDGTIVVHGDPEQEGDQFKVVNKDDSQTKVLEGMGVDFAGNTYYGDLEDGFGDMDRLALKRGGGAGRRITSTLDANGATAARAKRDDSGSLVLHDGGFPEHNGGLMEYHPDGRDGDMPRRALDPELRPDVAGREVVIMLQRLAEIDPDYDGPAYWATVFANLEDERQSELAERYAEQDAGGDDSDAEDPTPEDYLTELDGTEFLRLKPTSEFEHSEGNIARNGWIEWNPDFEDADDMLEVNQRRVEADFDPYVPTDENGAEVHDRDDIIPDGYDGDVRVGASANQEEAEA